MPQGGVVTKTYCIVQTSPKSSLSTNSCSLGNSALRGENFSPKFDSLLRAVPSCWELSLVIALNRSEELEICRNLGNDKKDTRVIMKGGVEFWIAYSRLSSLSQTGYYREYRSGGRSGRARAEERGTMIPWMISLWASER